MKAFIHTVAGVCFALLACDTLAQIMPPPPGGGTGTGGSGTGGLQTCVGRNNYGLGSNVVYKDPGDVPTGVQPGSCWSTQTQWFCSSSFYPMGGVFVADPGVPNSVMGSILSQLQALFPPNGSNSCAVVCTKYYTDESGAHHYVPDPLVKGLGNQSNQNDCDQAARNFWYNLPLP